MFLFNFVAPIFSVRHIDLNTSYVSIQFRKKTGKEIRKVDLNTSYVSIQCRNMQKNFVLMLI